MPLTRSAALSPVFTLRSAVPRRYPWLPKVTATSLPPNSTGSLLTWFTAPPVLPRPNSMLALPRSTSRRSQLKVSRS